MKIIMNREKIKQFILKYFFLPSWLTLIISIPSFILVILSLNGIFRIKAINYICYTFSAYGLIIFCTGAKNIFFDLKKLIKNNRFWIFITNTKLVNRFLTDVSFRMKISLFIGLFINLFYSSTNLISGISTRSVWFISMFGYYIILSFLKFYLLFHVKRYTLGENLISEYKKIRFCGYMLLLMNQALVVVVMFIVKQNKVRTYPGFLIYVVAIHAFYSVISTSYSLIKFKKYGSPVLSASKAISFTSALVSMLSLETTMLTHFGNNNNLQYKGLMTAITGVAVCLIVLGIAIFMIYHSTVELNKNLKK